MTYNEPDKAVVLAATDLVGRTGAKGVTFGHLHGESERAGWWAKAQFKGAVVVVENQAGPEEALTALCERLLTGAQCQRCGGLVALRDDGAMAYPDAPRPDGTRWTREEIEAAGLCRWTRQGERWESGCTIPPDGNDEIHTTEKLARALEALDDPRVKPLVWRARRGYYHDFLSPCDMPETELVKDLRDLELEDFAQSVINGQYDASRAESDAWFQSDEGQSVFAELVAANLRPASERPTGAAFWSAQRRPE